MLNNKLILFNLDFNNINHRIATAELHNKLLNDSFVALLGKNFMIDFYYKLLIKSQIINCIMCKEKDTYVGFVVYTQYPFSFMSKGFKKHFFFFLKFFVSTLINNPKKIMLFGKIIKEGLNRKYTKKEDLDSNVGELLSIGILPNYLEKKDANTNLSISRLLLNHMIKDFKKNGMNCIRVVCKKDNINAIKFYESYAGKIIDKNYPGNNFLFMINI